MTIVGLGDSTPPSATAKRFQLAINLKRLVGGLGGFAGGRYRVATSERELVPLNKLIPFPEKRLNYADQAFQHSWKGEKNDSI